MDLGANEWMTFWKVTFPLILPGIMAAALLAFSLSIDDFVITNFTAGQTQTFPMYIYGSYRIGIPVQVNVIGTIIFLIAVGAVLLSDVPPAAGPGPLTDDLRRRDRRAARVNAPPSRGARHGRHDRHPGPRRARRGAAPRPLRRPRRLGPDHEPPASTAARARWLITTRRRALPRLHRRGSASRTPATLTRGSWRRSRPRRRSSSTASRTSSTTSPACGSTTGCAHRAPGRPVAGVPVELRRRGGRGRGQARPRRDRAARRSSCFRDGYPRPDGPDDGADDREGRLPRRLRAAARAPSTTRPTRTATALPAARTRPTPVHLRLGGPARPHLPPADLPRAGGRGHRRAGPRRGRLRRPAAGLPAAPPRDHPRARHPARRRRGPDRLRADRRAVRGPPLGRRAGHPRHGQGDRVRPAAVGDPRPRRAAWRRGGPAPTAARTAATSSPARRPTRPSTSSRTRASWRTPGSAARSSSPGSARSRRGTRPSATSAASGSWLALEFVKPGEGDGRVPDPELAKTRPGGGARSEADRPDGRLVRQRRPDHPAARHDGRRGRPRARDPRGERRGRDGASVIRGAARGA